MPIYEYQCQACHERCEKLEKVSAEPAVECPSCKEPALKRQVSAAAFHLKGTGWYVTDFRDKDKKTTDSSAKDTKTDTKKTESKTTTTKETPAKTDTKQPAKEAKKDGKDK